MPFIVRAPGIVPAGEVCDVKNLVPLMTGQVKETPVTHRYFYYDSHLQAVRSGRWKLILPRPKCPPWLTDKGQAKNYRGVDVEAIPHPQLYDLQNDIGDYNRIGRGARFYDNAAWRPDVARWKNR